MRKARELELKYLRDLGVFEKVRTRFMVEAVVTDLHLKRDEVNTNSDGSETHSAKATVEEDHHFERDEEDAGSDGDSLRTHQTLGVV